MTYNTLAPKDIVDKTIQALNAKHIEATAVKSRAGTLEKIKTLIPKGASVMNGSSVTLEQIGFVDYLKSGNHGWNNLHEAIVAEKDPVKQAMLRKQAVLSDYYVGSVHMILVEEDLGF